jgi:hypothetical protein
MVFHQIRKLLNSKGNNCQNKKKANRMEENIASYSPAKILISRIYKELKS